MSNLLQNISDWAQINIEGEIIYVLLIMVLFIVPRLFIRFGIPMALTAFFLGLLASKVMNFGIEDDVIPIFSTLGIISLFLFAGLEVDFDQIRKYYKLIFGHLGIRFIVLALLSYILIYVFGITISAAVVLALALATPSTGFILDNIGRGNLSEDQKFWISIKAITAELIALGALLVFSQLGHPKKLTISILVIALLVVGLPYILNKLAKTIEKHAPGSEFTFIFMLAIIAGIITKKLGAYYLVGAFIVGMAAGQYNRKAMNPNTEKMLNSLKSFSSFFMPFYFFYSGLKMPLDAFSVEAIKIAGFFLLITYPMKLGSIIVFRRYALKETFKDSFIISVSLMPNLVFGLVLADILKGALGLSLPLYGGLITYTLVITTISPLILKLTSDPSVSKKIADSDRTFE